MNNMKERYSGFNQNYQRYLQNSKEFLQSAKENAYGFSNAYRGFIQRPIAQAAHQGLMETFGFSYDQGISRGFLGFDGQINTKGLIGAFKPARQAFSHVRKRRGVLRGLKAGTKTYLHASKLGGLKGMSVLGGAAMVGFTAYSAYEGYKEGGVIGAAKEVGTNALINAGFNIALRAAGLYGGMAIGVGTAAVIGYGAYKYGEAAIRHKKKLTNIEMGGNFTDNYNTVATMRQRSLMAIQNTHLSSRSALGNEAQFLHNPYLR